MPLDILEKHFAVAAELSEELKVKKK